MHRQSGIAYAAQLGFSYVHIGDMIEQVVQFEKVGLSRRPPQTPSSSKGKQETFEFQLRFRSRERV